MFKKLYHEIQELQKYVDAVISDMHDFYRAVAKDLTSIKTSVSRMAKIESLENTIESQQQTIKALTGALVNKYEHGLFVFSEDCRECAFEPRVSSLLPKSSGKPFSLTC